MLPRGWFLDPKEASLIHDNLAGIGRVGVQAVADEHTHFDYVTITRNDLQGYDKETDGVAICVDLVFAIVTPTKSAFFEVERSGPGSSVADVIGPDLFGVRTLSGFRAAENEIAAVFLNDANTDQRACLAVTLHNRTILNWAEFEFGQKIDRNRRFVLDATDVLSPRRCATRRGHRVG